MRSIKVRYIVGIIAIVSMALVAASVVSAIVTCVWSVI